MNEASSGPVRRWPVVLLTASVVALFLMQLFGASALSSGWQLLATPALLAVTALALGLVLVDARRSRASWASRFPDPAHFQSSSRRLMIWTVLAVLVALVGAVLGAALLRGGWGLLLPPLAMVVVLVATVRASLRLQRAELARAPAPPLP
ncbi:MAG TPA: hypothetical protein VGU43_00635 [Thermoplasmata archaeon]|nr:hypothetical protein [Thermoplasmata archaeon]